MNISIEKLDGVAVVVAEGRLDAMGAPEIESNGKDLLRDGATRILLDLGKVAYISSAGLRSLLVLGKAVKAAGGAMALCSLVPAVHEVMAFSGFDAILTIAADRPAALQLLK